MLMRFNPTTNQDSMIWNWIIGGLLSVVGHGYVRQLLWELLLPIVGNFFVVGLRDTTMTNWSVSESFRNDLLKIASTIIFHLIEVSQQIIYLPLMRSMMEIQFLLAVRFIFLVVFLPLQLSTLFPTWLSTVPQLYPLDLSILTKNKKLNREGYITGLLEVTVQLSRLMEIDTSIEASGFARYVIGSKRSCTIVEKFSVIVLKHIMNTLFVSLDMFHV